MIAPPKLSSFEAMISESPDRDDAEWTSVIGSSASAAATTPNLRSKGSPKTALLQANLQLAIDARANLQSFIAEQGSSTSDKLSNVGELLGELVDNLEKECIRSVVTSTESTAWTESARSAE